MFKQKMLFSSFTKFTVMGLGMHFCCSSHHNSSMVLLFIPGSSSLHLNMRHAGVYVLFWTFQNSSIHPCCISYYDYQVCIVSSQTIAASCYHEHNSWVSNWGRSYRLETTLRYIIQIRLHKVYSLLCLHRAYSLLVKDYWAFHTLIDVPFLQ